MDDLISRQAAIDAIRTKYCPSDFMDDGVIDAFAEIIQDMPSAQPERKTGKWIDGYKRQRCSICRYSGVRSWEYCPSCGARMVQEGEDNGKVD